MSNGIFLLLGTNQGDKRANLLNAMHLIEQSVGKVLKVSSIYKTAPWGNTDQPEFFNQVITVESILKPDLLLKSVLAIELKMGRKRLEKWGPRVIDIDILFYNHEIVQSKDLTIPHPAIPLRKFTLIPLAEIAPGFLHPALKKNMKELLSECEDSLPVVKVMN
jgi:2-amino-4-hydroxy-6-hydroxymethyldihydropteridine diphosphokinase